MNTEFKTDEWRMVTVLFRGDNDSAIIWLKLFLDTWEHELCRPDYLHILKLSWWKKLGFEDSCPLFSQPIICPCHKRMTRMSKPGGISSLKDTKFGSCWLKDNNIGWLLSSYSIIWAQLISAKYMNEQINATFLWKILENSQDLFNERNLSGTFQSLTTIKTLKWGYKRTNIAWCHLKNTVSWQVTFMEKKEWWLPGSRVYG